MKATVTSKGQITIPLRLRQKLHLEVGDQFEFDEDSPVLSARRAVNRGEWESTMAEWRESRPLALKGHSWEDQGSGATIDDLRGGAADGTQPDA